MKSLLRKLFGLTLVAALLSLGEAYPAHCVYDDDLGSAWRAQRHLLQSRLSNVSETEASALTQVVAAIKSLASSQVQHALPRETASVSAEASQKLGHDKSTFRFLDALVRGWREGRPIVIFMTVFGPAWICIVFSIMLMMGWESKPEKRNERSLDLGRGLTPNVQPVRTCLTTLCEELVAPVEDACSISVPSLAELQLADSAHVSNIVNKMGKPLVQVKVTRLEGNELRELPAPAPAIMERLELRGFRMQNLLGSCEIHIHGHEGDVQPHVFGLIYNSAREKFAMLKQCAHEEQQRTEAGSTGDPLYGHKLFSLSSIEPEGWNLRIQGNFAERFVTVLDQKQRQISVVMPGAGADLNRTGRAASNAQYYKLRIQPRVDGGVVLAALLAIDRWPGVHEPPIRAARAAIDSQSSLAAVNQRVH